MTTLDPSTVATMQGRELDAAVAKALFGWSWFRYKRKGDAARKHTFQPPESDGWTRSPWGPDLFEPVDAWMVGPEERYVDWDRGGWLDLGNGITQLGLPHYSTGPAAFFAMVERVKELGWWRRMSEVQKGEETPWKVSLTCAASGLVIDGYGDTLPLAFARAALLTTIPKGEQ